ncbi:MAG: hypothetical protein VYC34_10185, partial [Planctomycetota bacterium]|nr:hypothetical protein [Planctomycetota bacterium]
MRRMKIAMTWAVLGLAVAAPCAALAQGRGGMSGGPEVSTGVLRAIEAPYLSDAERAAKRVFHGLWKESDLEDPALRAQAALMVGALEDWSLGHEAAAVEDRAEAALARGEAEAALETLTGAQSARARRIRAEALATLGRYEEADAAVEPLVQGLLRQRTESAE